jgi:transcriptional regulator GlxA family with amidase domain
MAENAETLMTVSSVAAQLGVSLRSLQSGFRQWRNTTPNAHLRNLRLQRVREELLRVGGGANVTAVALRYGFSHLGRFSAHYRSAFGESPSATLRRGRTLDLRVL